MNDLAFLEIFRWGFASVPGSLFHYAHDLELDMEDLGFLSVIFLTFQKTNPLTQRGVNVGQLLKNCPFYSLTKVSRRLSRLQSLGLVELLDSKPKNLANRTIYLEPLFERLAALVKRDHLLLFETDGNEHKQQETEYYLQKIHNLEAEVAMFKNPPTAPQEEKSIHFVKLSEFISRKTGNLLSPSMTQELTKWLNECKINPEFLYCMLELSFERGITNPRTITGLVKDIREYKITTLDGLESYFQNFVDAKEKPASIKPLDVELIELSKYLNIDMQAEARQNIYYKWRYEWNFSQAMILKAGELMSSRTTSGGLEYVDSILQNWLNQEIKDLAAVEKELARYKNSKHKNQRIESKAKNTTEEYRIYIPKDELKKLQSDMVEV